MTKYIMLQTILRTLPFISCRPRVRVLVDWSDYYYYKRTALPRRFVPRNFNSKLVSFPTPKPYTMKLTRIVTCTLATEIVRRRRIRCRYNRHQSTITSRLPFTKKVDTSRTALYYGYISTYKTWGSSTRGRLRRMTAHGNRWMRTPK